MLVCTAFAPEESTERSPASLVNGAGMSGEQGMDQTHSNDMTTMWLTKKEPGTKNWVGFDFGIPQRLGYLCVWNFNQPAATGSGLRKVSLMYSLDGQEWTEWKGPGYPYEFAQADGSDQIRPTNLTTCPGPIDLGGITARYIKLIPDPRAGEGCWGGYLEGQLRFGLSAVRFFSYKPAARAHGILSAAAICADPAYGTENLCNNRGMTSDDTPAARHGNNPDSMFLTAAVPSFGALIFDLDGTYPLETMHIWNYNEPGQTAAGLRKIRLFTSIDQNIWTELKGPGYPYELAPADGSAELAATNLNDGQHTPIVFDGIRARYVKLLVDGASGSGTWGGYHGYEFRYGLSAVRFYADTGYCIEPARDYTQLVSQYHGWGGGDGIFSVSTDGRDGKKRGAERADAHTILVFGDSFVGESDPITHSRKTAVMINNTACYWAGCDPHSLRAEFDWNRNPDGSPASLVTIPPEKSYYCWLQDCVIVNGYLYSFAGCLQSDPSQPEGFQFKQVGLDLIRFEVQNHRLKHDSMLSLSTPLYDDLGKLSFGCAILPLHDAGGLEMSDGFIYIYGHGQAHGGRQLYVCRVRPEQLEDFSAYTFFDGETWSRDIRRAYPICETGCCEMSITPIESGPWTGKFLYTYMHNDIGDLVACRIGDTPWGPFGQEIPLYHVTMHRELNPERSSEQVYHYNAKAHYHLSSAEELLISYNINSTRFEAHMKNADIYHPRFLRLRRLAADPMY